MIAQAATMPGIERRISEFSVRSLFFLFISPSAVSRKSSYV